MDQEFLLMCSQPIKPWERERAENPKTRPQSEKEKPRIESVRSVSRN